MIGVTEAVKVRAPALGSRQVTFVLFATQAYAIMGAEKHPC
jgi:hypothetical protein